MLPSQVQESPATLQAQIGNLLMVDGAFSQETDPAPNPPEPFAEAFDGTGIIVNARIVGHPDIITNQVRKLWRLGTPQEQHEVYQKVHAICS